MLIEIKCSRQTMYWGTCHCVDPNRYINNMYYNCNVLCVYFCAWLYTILTKMYPDNRQVKNS